MHDLVIRNGTVVDGTGAARCAADVAIDDAVISAVAAPGEILKGQREIDAAAEHGELTGAHPGRLQRGPSRRPAAVAG